MKSLYLQELEVANALSNDSDKLNYLSSIIRSLLQTTSVSIFELTKEYTPFDETDLTNLIERFLTPADGLPVEIIDSLLPALRTYYDNQFIYGWFEKSKKLDYPLAEKLLEWVEFRNARPAHGVVNPEIAEIWAKKTQELIINCLDILSQLIPIYKETSFLQLGKIEISVPLINDGKLIVIRGVIQRKGIWKLKGQYLAVENSNEFTTDLEPENIFATNGVLSKSKYKLVDIYNGNSNSSVFHNIPIRQTDTFHGRENEISSLAEWFNDSDSRTCLVFGDGGYGKTTLVLEFLNQIIESTHNFEKKLPVIISYQTAKMTKWTENGIVHLTSVTPVMDECIRELARFSLEILTKDWFQSSGRHLVDKCAGILASKEGLVRDDVLLVLDNTETLATSAVEVKELGDFISYIGKRIGRVIITSRRREFLNTTPIAIEGLTEKDAVELIKDLGQKYKADAVIRSGESSLRKVVKQLMYKPLLIEVLVKYLSHSNKGIDDAMSSVYKQTDDELLEFLYEDAWLRMNEFQKSVFLVLVQISSPIDNHAISKACQEVGIQQTEFSRGLEETHFSVTTEEGANFSIEIVSFAKRFFFKQISKLDETKRDLIKGKAGLVDEYVSEIVRLEKEYKRDRVAEAFRSEYAKAAKVYADKGDVKSAEEMYKLAIDDDPLNSALHDRFSYFLLHKLNNPEYAKEISAKAVKLDANNCDANVGYALVCYKLGDIESGDTYIDKANKIGRPASFCNLRKAIARFYKSSSLPKIEEQILLLLEAEKFIKDAKQYNLTKNGYDAKNQDDILKYERKIAHSLSMLRAKVTRGRNI